MTFSRLGWVHQSRTLLVRGTAAPPRISDTGSGRGNSGIRYPISGKKNTAPTDNPGPDNPGLSGLPTGYRIPVFKILLHLSHSGRTLPTAWKGASYDAIDHPLWLRTLSDQTSKRNLHSERQREMGVSLVTVWDSGFRVERLGFGVQGLLRATEREGGEAY